MITATHFASHVCASNSPGEEKALKLSAFFAWRERERVALWFVEEYEALGVAAAAAAAEEEGKGKGNGENDLTFIFENE